MTETTHSRSRGASLGGLVLQLLAFLGTLGLALYTHSPALWAAAWYVLGGVPIWFVTLLVFRQRELAALEALDLEELRRERQATGGAAAMFSEEGGGGLAFRVAEARVRWMQKWLVPGFALGAAAYLAGMGIYIWQRFQFLGYRFTGGTWPAVENIPVALVVLSVLMLATFLLARYTSGMARTAPAWQLLRGCGAYMIGNALVYIAIMVGLGVLQYSRAAGWEHVLAYAIPVLMLVLAVEIVLNFVLDIYRPRAPGVEPRAAYDSRLLGLVAEPGGIASSVAEALNYQFGFQVSQTWFYQLLARAFVPLVGTGVVALWLLTCIVVVQPYERVIIERWGRQLNPGGAGRPAPLEPGLHFKWPAPIDRARAYNTGQLHQISVGFINYDAQPKFDADKHSKVQLWTDTTHLGLDHFNFLVVPDLRAAAATTTAPADQRPADRAPVHMLRMEVVVQYQINADELQLYTQAMQDPHRKLRDVAWEEVVRYASSTTPDFLMSRDRAEIGDTLRERITQRIADLGLAVVYVGITNIHPETTVATAYREVIGAEQQKTAAIRQARVTENERLSKVAGDAQRARLLARYAGRLEEASRAQNAALLGLATADRDSVERWTARLDEFEPLFVDYVEAVARFEDARDWQRQVEEDYSAGLGQTFGAQAQASEAVQEAKTARDEAQARLEAALAPVRAEAAAALEAGQVQKLVESVAARVAGAYWEARGDEELSRPELGGEAAVLLAQALAQRWNLELGPRASLVQVENEREAYRAAPELYKTRRLVQTLTDGIKNARKFFLAFDPGERRVRVRFVAEDERGLTPASITAPDNR